MPRPVPSLLSSASLVTAVYRLESLYHVDFPTIPSAASPKMFWNFTTAARVLSPKVPDASVITGMAG